MGAELTCAEAEAVAWRAAVGSAVLEGVVAGAPVALCVALVGLLESGSLAWSAGAVCGAMVLWIVFKGRVPSRLESLARADAELGLRGALEVGVTLEEQERESRYGEAIAAALAGRLGSAQVARAGVALKPTLLGVGLLVSFALASAIRAESRGDVDLREARLMAGRPTLGEAEALGAEAEMAAAREAAESEAQAQAKAEQGGASRASAASAASETNAADAGAGATAALPGPGEAAEGAGEAEASGGSNLQNNPLSASETSKLAVGAPSGVTPGAEGGKIAASPASRASGAWWPARHDAVVRAWLDSLNSSVQR